MYTFSDKSSRNSHSNRASKPYESKRWDHGGFDQLQTEQSSRYNDKSDKLIKQRRFQDDNTMASDVLTGSDQGSKIGTTSDKWTHDKYDEISNNAQTESKTQGASEKEKTQKPNRKERKPDRKLYSVRDKRGQEEPNTTIPKEKRTEGKETQEKDKTIIKNEEVIKGQKGFEKEIHGNGNEDDAISNVSTAISDPLKGFEEESSIIKESQNISAIKAIGDKPKDIKKDHEDELLFQIVLDIDTDKREVVKIYENEGDYEGLLDNLCQKNGIGKRMSLYFKIDVIQMIQEAHPDPRKFDGVLDKLLDLNYKLIAADEGETAIDESLLPYIANEEEIFDDVDPEWKEEEAL